MRLLLSLALAAFPFAALADGFQPAPTPLTNGAALVGGGWTVGNCLIVGAGPTVSNGACLSGGSLSSVSNADGTLTISPTTGAVVASVNKAQPNAFTGQQNFAMATLAGSGTIAWALNTQQVASTTLTASSTLATPTNMVAGGTYVLEIIQGGAGSFTLTWPSNVKWPGGTAPTLSTAVGAVDFVSFISDGTSMYGVWQGNFH